MNGGDATNRQAARLSHGPGVNRCRCDACGEIGRAPHWTACGERCAGRALCGLSRDLDSCLPLIFCDYYQEAILRPTRMSSADRHSDEIMRKAEMGLERKI
jgi:hypothetical protein